MRPVQIADTKIHVVTINTFIVESFSSLEGRKV